MNKTPEQIAEQKALLCLHIAEQKAWTQIIGKKIICSECNNRDPECFGFTLTKRGPKHFVGVRCTLCSHEGDYNPTDEEVYQYEFIARANIDKQILEEHGENPPITNVEVDSVFRRENWKEDVDPDKIAKWEAKCDENYALEA